MSRNKLTRIDESQLKGLSQLEKLLLNYNEIKEIDEFAFSCMPTIHYLDLSHNRIEVLESNTFHNLINLKHLMLNNNRLFHIDKRTFTYAKLKSILLVSLSNNNFSTECLSYYSENFILKKLLPTLDGDRLFSELSKMPFLSDWNKFTDQFRNWQQMNIKIEFCWKNPEYPILRVVY